MPKRWARVFLCLLLPALSPLPAQEASTRPEAEPRLGPASPADSAEAAYQFALAKLLVEESAFGEAQEAFEKALDLEGGDPYGYLEVAKFHFELAFLSRSAERRRQQLLQSAEYAEEALGLAPENHDVLSQYAQIHFRLGEHQLSSLEIARETLEKLRAAGEDDVQLLITLGQIYFMKRQPEKAADVMTEAASYLPNHRMVQSMLVDALLAAGRRGELEDALVKLIELDPGNLDERLRLAELRHENGDHRGAVKALRTAPPEVRGEARLQRALAQALFLIGENEDALVIADRLIEQEPEAKDMKRLRVSLLNAMARYARAIDELRPLLETIEDPGRRLQESAILSRLLERVGRSDEAVDVLKSALADQAQDGPHLQLKMALAGVLERHGRGAEAIEMLEGELEAADAEQVAIYGAALSEILDRAQRPDEAVRVLDAAAARMREAGNEAGIAGLELRKLGILAASERWQEIIDLAPSLMGHASADLRSAALRLHAQALAELGQVDEALMMLEPRPEASPGDPAAEAPPQDGARERESAQERLLLAARVGILFDHGRDDEARHTLEEVAAPGKVNDLFFAARLYQRSQRYGPVIELMGELLTREPESLDALFMLGSAQERNGASGDSIATFRRLLELEPDHAPTLNYLGYMWAEVGENLEEALDLIRRAVALAPDNGAYVDSLGWAFHQLGRYEEARQNLEWAARLLPSDPTIFEHLGDLYRRLGRFAPARESYRRALELGAENLEEVQRKLESLEKKGP